MAKKARVPSAERPAEPDPLTAAVERLADAVIVLRDAVDEIREDISWLSRNGLSVQPIEHVVVKRMARNPCAANWSEHLHIERSTFPADQSGSLLDADTCNRIAEELTATFEAVAQGQLEVVLTALDGVRDEILAALKRPLAKRTDQAAVPAAEPPPAPAPASDPTRDSPPRGSLF